jgi:glycosyltransferase involved in cell wall biosynthesis
MRPMPRWVDVDHFTPSSRDPALWPNVGVLSRVRLLYAGRLSREKDLPLLVDIFQDLTKAGHDVSLIVAGDGPYRAEMERALFGYPVLFLGFLSQEELARIYASADIFVFPSSTDTFGNVVLEAQACGSPVLVSDQGGPKELVEDGVGGLVLPANDRQAWTEALAALIEDDERRLRMGREARRFVEERALTTRQHFTTLLFPGGATGPAAAGGAPAAGSSPAAGGPDGGPAEAEHGKPAVART